MFEELSGLVSTQTGTEMRTHVASDARNTLLQARLCIIVVLDM